MACTVTFVIMLCFVYVVTIWDVSSLITTKYLFHFYLVASDLSLFLGYIWCLLKEFQFECVPTSLLEQVAAFLNVRTCSTSAFSFICWCLMIKVVQDVREDLRYSMAKDAETINNECLRINEDPLSVKTSVNADKEKLPAMLPKDLPLDFQKKVTISKHGRQDTDSEILLGKNDTSKPLRGMSTLALTSYDCTEFFRITSNYGLEAYVFDHWSNGGTH